MTTEAFIKLNENQAIKESVRSKIPASITMGQAILESGSGNSRLAREANNLFGIKCHSGWYGEYIFATDDAPDECFRKYPTTRDSFKDHTNFLKKYPRYQKLFSLDPTDYIGWARGLKNAGYATAQNYDQVLINIIKKYGLDKLDRRAYRRKLFLYIGIPFLTILLSLLIIIYIRLRKKKLING